MEENQGNQADLNNSSNSHHRGAERSEPVRSRWTPKPEQILILESIFSSGMVNPPKEETIRIRKLLEKFGSVGDANVFYWFQNRRSRSRRRQRELQANLQGGGDQRVTGTLGTMSQVQVSNGGAGAIHQYMDSGGSNNYFMSSGFSSSPTSFGVSSRPSYVYGSSSSSSSSCGVGGEYGVESFFPMTSQMEFQDMDQHGSGLSHPVYSSFSQISDLHYQNGGYITAFVNGVATEFPTGSIDIRAMFGDDVLLVHSSGIPLPTNEYGFLMQSLEHGESYFLVSRST